MPIRIFVLKILKNNYIREHSRISPFIFERIRIFFILKKNIRTNTNIFNFEKIYSNEYEYIRIRININEYFGKKKKMKILGSDEYSDEYIRPNIRLTDIRGNTNIYIYIYISVVVR